MWRPSSDVSRAYDRRVRPETSATIGRPILVCVPDTGGLDIMKNAWQTELSSVAPIPDGTAFLVSEHKRIATFRDLPREDEIGPVLFHLRAGERNLVPFGEAHAHVVEKRFRTEV